MHRCCGVFHMSFFLFPPFYYKKKKNRRERYKSGGPVGSFLYSAQTSATSLEDCNKFDTRGHLFKFIWNKTFPFYLWTGRALEAQPTLVVIEFSRSTSVICHQLLSYSPIWHGASLMNSLVELSPDYIEDAARKNAKQMKNNITGSRRAQR